MKKLLTTYKKGVFAFAMLLLCLSAGAQNAPIRISGTVIDQERNPLVGAMVSVQGTNTTTITDAEGIFYLSVPSQSTVLNVHLLGYKDQQVGVGDKIFFEIAMQPDAMAMDEVVVTAFGHQRRLSVIGSVETVDPGNLEVGTTRRLSNNLAGQVAGLIATRQRGGEPGYDESEFWIRGIASFSGNTTPLVLVDGIERGLNDIDPAEIESFSILKDASASAMYGVRGANGVIIINTKRGRIGAPTVDVRFEHSVMTPTKLPKFVDAATHMELLNELTPAGVTKPYSQQRIDRTRTGFDPDLYPDVNWIDAVTKDFGYSTRANMTVGGGTDFLRYSLVAAYLNEQGIVERDYDLPYDTSIQLNRYNMRANVDIDITKTTMLRMNIGGYLQQRRSPDFSIEEMFNNAFLTSSFVHPTKYSDGTIPRVNERVNPWADATQNGFKRDSWSQIQSLFSLEQGLDMITKGLRAKATFSFDSYAFGTVTRNRDAQYYGVATGRDIEGNLIHGITTASDESLGKGNSGQYGNKRVYFEGNITYNRSFGLHDVDALLLYNQQSYDDPGRGDDNVGALQAYRKQGIAGRLSYTYDNRYVTEFNFGYNGSENFEPGHRYGFFPSLAVGWIASEEHFMESVKDTFSKIKLRASAGMVGNDDIGGSRRFAYLTTMNTWGGAYGWGGQGNRNGIREGQIGVANMTWETAWKYNVGLEIGLWNDLNFQVDVFQEDRSNIFMQRNIIPSQTGFQNNPWANFGKVRNRGIEASVNYLKNINDDWDVSFRGSFTYARNTVIERDEAAIVKGTHRSNTGRSMNTLWGLVAERLFTADDFDSEGNLLPEIPAHNVGASIVYPGDIKYVDRNDDGVVDGNDEGYIGGTVAPRIIYGFGGSARYRSFDFSFFFQGTGDSHRIIGNTSYFFPGSGQGLLGNPYSNWQDRWTEDNPSQNVFWPRLSNASNRHNYQASTWWKKDMSFLRLKTIEIGYSMNPDWIEKAGMKGLRVYVSGNDLFYFSKFKMWDPEVDTNTGLQYPNMSSVMVGINVNF